MIRNFLGALIKILLRDLSTKVVLKGCLEKARNVHEFVCTAFVAACMSGCHGGFNDTAKNFCTWDLVLCTEYLLTDSNLLAIYSEV